MIERSLIHVYGPAGAGKTTLLAHMVRKVRPMAAAVRCIRDEALAELEASAPQGHAELDAYRQAGADPVGLFRYPGQQAPWDVLFSTELMAEHARAVFLEGDEPLEPVDLGIYVAPPVPDGGRLLVREMTDPAQERAAAIEGLEYALASRDELVPRLSALIGLPFSFLVSRHDDAVTDELEQKATAELARLRQAPLPAAEAYWALTQGYEGIERAQLVVINVRAGEHEQAASMLHDLRRLRADKDVFADIFDWRGKRTPITAVIADLANPRDPGLGKARARVNRTLRRSG